MTTDFHCWDCGHHHSLSILSPLLLPPVISVFEPLSHSLQIHNTSEFWLAKPRRRILTIGPRADWGDRGFFWLLKWTWGSCHPGRLPTYTPSGKGICIKSSQSQYTPINGSTIVATQDLCIFFSYFHWPLPVKKISCYHFVSIPCTKRRTHLLSKGRQPRVLSMTTPRPWVLCLPSLTLAIPFLYSVNRSDVLKPAHTRHSPNWLLNTAIVNNQIIYAYNEMNYIKGKSSKS